MTPMTPYSVSSAPAPVNGLIVRFLEKLG